MRRGSVRNQRCCEEKPFYKNGQKNLITRKNLSDQLFIQPFDPNVTILYPLQASWNCKVFWCFQGGLYIVNKRVQHKSGYYVSFSA